MSETSSTDSTTDYFEKRQRERKDDNRIFETSLKKVAFKMAEDSYSELDKQSKDLICSGKTPSKLLSVLNSRFVAVLAGVVSEKGQVFQGMTQQQLAENLMKTMEKILRNSFIHGLSSGANKAGDTVV